MGERMLGEPATGRLGQPTASAGGTSPVIADATGTEDCCMDSQIMQNYLLFSCCMPVSVQLKGN